MGQHLGLSRGPLAVRVARSGRLLPRPIRQDLLAVAEAQYLSGHPRLAPQIDRAAVRSAYKRAIWHLRGPEMDDIRKGRRLGALGALAANLLIVFAMVIVVLWWRNFV